MATDDAAFLAELDADYQTHCEDCFMGMPEYCEGATAPNGQPCATTDADRAVYFRMQADRMLAQRDEAAARVRALESGLRELVSAVSEWLEGEAESRPTRWVSRDQRLCEAYRAAHQLAYPQGRVPSGV